MTPVKFALPVSLTLVRNYTLVSTMSTTLVRDTLSVKENFTSVNDTTEACTCVNPSPLSPSQLIMTPPKQLHPSVSTPAQDDRQLLARPEAKTVTRQVNPCPHSPSQLRMAEPSTVTVKFSISYVQFIISA
jgi:hypothetical protein